MIKLLTSLFGDTTTRRLPVFFVVVLLSVTALSAQDLEKIAALKKELATSKGKARFDALNRLAWEFRSAFPDSAIRYGQQALDLATELKLPRGQATSLNYIGLANYYKGNLVRAFELYDRAEREATSAQDTIELGYAQNNIGRLFAEQGMLTQAYPYFVKAESMFKATNELSGLAYVYQSFASLYKTQTDFVKAEQNYQEALQIRQQLGNTRDIMSAMTLLGKLYMEIKQYDDALLYFQKADSAGRTINDALGLAELKILMAEYYLGKKDLDRAQHLCLEGLGYILNFKNVKIVPRSYLVLGEIYFEQKSYAVAKKYFTIALGTASHMKYLDLSMQSHYYLWKISEIEGNREAALLHSNQYLVLRDSVNDINVSDRIAKFQFQLEIERKQQENEILKANQLRDQTIIHQQEQQRAGLALLALLVTGLLYFQWRNAKKRKEANEKLSEQKIRIEQINGELANLVEETSKRNEQLRNHLTTLMEFSKRKVVNFGTTLDAAQDVCRLTANSLTVSRISIWEYNHDEHTIQSLACYELASDRFLDPIKLDLSKFPAYDHALRTKRIIDAPDARTHPETREFKETYLMPLNIHSMLDVTFSVDDELDGLICCEQQGGPRVWKSEDIIFVSAVADVISLAYRSAQRREYERKLKTQSKEIARMNEELERRVKERTEELENRNHQLTEYAFINSHLLRSPVSKIMGLINLMEMDESVDKKMMMEHLKKSCDELDAIVKKITIALDGGEHFDRSFLEK